MKGMPLGFRRDRAAESEKCMTIIRVAHSVRACPTRQVSASESNVAVLAGDGIGP